MARFTGERIIPETNELQYTFARHEVVYWAITRHVQNKRLLDCGCGEGYGANLLAQQALTVTAIDRAGIAISEAQTKYQRPILTFQEQDLEQPWSFASGIFDAAACCQVIEHINRPDHVLRELRRVLSDHGWAALSTPNRVTFSPTGDMLDPYHVREYNRQEYEAFLRQVFPAVRVYSLTGNSVVLDHLRRDVQTIRRVVRLDVLHARRWLPMPMQRWLYDLGLNGLRKLQNTSQHAPVSISDFCITAEPVPEDQVLDLIGVVGQRPEDLPDLSQ